MNNGKVTLELLGILLHQALDKLSNIEGRLQLLDKSQQNMRRELAGFRSETMYRSDQQDEKFANLIDRLDRHERRLSEREERQP